MRFSKPWLKVVANLLGNMAAAWFAAGMIIPNLARVSLGMLIFDLMSGTVYLLLAVEVEKQLEKYD